MKYFLFLLTACFINCSYAQDSTAADSSYVYYIPHAFYTDAPGTFMAWEGEQPKTFCFRLLDRWGTELFCEEKDLAFQFNNIPEKNLKDSTSYLMILDVVMADGRSFSVRKQLYYVSFYCAG